VRLLFIGDIVGKPGRSIVRQALRPLIEREELDVVVANAENCAGGSGLTPANYAELMQCGIDGITLGDHVYRRREIMRTLEEATNIVKPANLPPDSVGRRWAVITARNGERVAICALLGRLFMKPIDCPWHAADKVLSEIPSDVRIRFVDFHAEATSEMQLMGRHLDGRVTAVLGTHTHVPTADECVLPKGTAFQCDVGMTGPYESIIGRRIDRVLESTLTSLPLPFDVATGDPRLSGTIVDVDVASGLATGIRRIVVNQQQASELAKG
jgi:2',3'-cyclic-nucleotide 2'-phosphodiesterase